MSRPLLAADQMTDGGTDYDEVDQLCPIKSARKVVRAAKASPAKDARTITFSSGAPPPMSASAVAIHRP